MEFYLKYIWSHIRYGEWHCGFRTPPNFAEARTEYLKYKEEFKNNPPGNECGAWGCQWFQYHCNYYDGYHRSIFIGPFYIYVYH